REEGKGKGNRNAGPIGFASGPRSRFDVVTGASAHRQELIEVRGESGRTDVPVPFPFSLSPLRPCALCPLPFPLRGAACTRGCRARQGGRRPRGTRGCAGRVPG